MYRRLPFLCLIIALALIFSSCVVHEDPKVYQALNIDTMDKAFEIRPSSIKQYDKCRNSCEIALINAEVRKEKYVFWDSFGPIGYTPHKYSETIIKYMGDELARRGVTLNSECPKKIMISLGESHFDQQAMGWSNGGFFELKIDIPALSYQKTYRGKDASVDIYKALAYAVHHSVIEFMKDPVVVKYIESTQ